MLVPAGMLVILILGAIAVDSAAAFMAQRELINQAAAIANDAVTRAIPAEGLQAGASASPDPAVVDRMVRESLVGRRIGGGTVRAEDIDVQVEGQVVRIRASEDVPKVFATAVPGAPRSARVRATVSAEVRFRQS